MKTKFHPVHAWTTGSALIVALVAVLLLLPRSEPSNHNQSPIETQRDATKQQNQIARKFGQLPLSFEANGGQTARHIDFVARGGGYTLFLSPTQATLSLKKSGDATVLRMNLLGANTKARSAGAQPLPGKVNYLLGNDRKKWRTGIETYAQVHYADVYRGIDLVYYGQQRQLEYDFVVKPGASTKTIRMGFGGAQKLRLDDSGELIVHTRGGEVRWHRPIAYQEVNGARRLVDARYELGQKQRVSFAVGNYDKSRPLIIDPILLYSTYLGGTGNDRANAIAVDNADNAYLAGETSSLDFPGAQNTVHGATDAFVTKLNASGSQVLFSTYVGGIGNDLARRIALDFNNAIYLAGETASSDFPTQAPQQSTFGGGATDGFIASLTSDGTSFNYATYLGGSGEESCAGMAVDSGSNAYVTGETSSSDFPVGTGSLQSVYGGGASDAFVAQFDTNGVALYSTYVGGSGADVGNAIAVSGAGIADVTGASDSTDFPVNGSIAFQSGNAGGTDAFLARIDVAQTGSGALLYSTYFGGSGNDQALDVVANFGNTYVTGSTNSTDLPLISTAFQNANAGGTDAFITRFDPSSFGSSSLIYTTYLGGTGNDVGRGIRISGIDSTAHIVGDTTSTDFPTQNALQPAHAADGGLRDAFAAKLDSTGNTLLGGTYFGGNGDDSANALALSNAGDVTLTGVTASGNLPVSSNAAQPTKNTGTDAFVSKMSFGTSFVVINTNDAGAGSLRQAITDANSSVGTDTITFAIPGTGVQTITLDSSLPGFFDPVIIDGYTQPGSTPNTLPQGTNAQLLIDIDGNRNFGLYAQAPGCKIRGLVLRNFDENGPAIQFDNNFDGDSGENGEVSGCFIGTQPNGTAAGVAVGNNPGDGIQTTGANNVTIGGPDLADRNLIAGNANGVSLDSDGNRVFNNLIGTQRNGTAALPNIESGMVLRSTSSNRIGDANFALGNVIAGNAVHGINSRRTFSGSGNTVINNRIGIGATGQTLGNGGDGVRFDGERSSTISGNLIGANGGDGIALEAIDADGFLQGASSNVIAGNFIGTNAQNLNRANAGNGIRLGFRSSQTTIGQSGTSGSNVIGLNGGNGIALVGDPNNAVVFTTIRNNFVGVAADGSTALPNQMAGISIQNATSTFIGGAVNGAGNVISGNSGNGIQFLNSDYADIKGNFIGTDAGGSGAIPNGGNGIGSNNSNDLIIGGITGRNIISGNGGNGLFLLNINNGIVQGNSIGTNAAGTVAMGNGGNGIALQGINNRIGGTATGQGNTIAFNGGSGVSVGGADESNPIRGNAIFSNGTLGIDQGSAGVTPNDAGDSDSVQNFPVINSARTIGTSTTITGTLNSAANTDFELDFFGNTAADPSGFGEGQTLIFSQAVTTDNAGNATFNFTTSAMSAGNFITATATRDLSFAYTSEFSRAAPVVTPAFSINDISGNEGNSGTTNAVFTVTLANPNPGTATVNYATSNGTAVAPADYTSSLGTLTFPSGTTTQTISVPIIGDMDVEANENFAVTLSGAVNATIADATGVGTIVNDDVPSLSINSGRANEGDEGTSNANFTVTLSQASPQIVRVDFATSDGTAVAPTDYTSTSGTLTFAPGQTTRPITVPIIGDTLVEPDETFTVNLSNPRNASVSVAQGTGTILNDDVANTPNLSLTIAPGTIDENGAASTCTVTRSGDPSSALVVQIDNNNPTRVSMPPSVTIPAGSISATFAITPIDNAIVDGNATATIRVSATGYRSDSANIVVQDDDTPALTLTIEPSTFSEAAGTRAARGEVKRNASIATPITVRVATNNTSKVRVPATITIPAGSGAASFVVGAVDNQSSDGDTSVLVRASAPDFASSTQTVVVTDNDSSQTEGSSVVSNTADSGAGSLRSALEFANSRLGTKISFRIPPGDAGFQNGVWRILLRQPLPALTAIGTVIDGNTQTRAAGNTNRRGPEIMIDGAALPSSSGVGADGLQIRASRCGIRGLIIGNFGGSGIDISGSTAFNNTLQGNYLGIDPSGALKASNGTSVRQSAGVRIAQGAHDNLIGGPGIAARNVISGNTFDGVLITGANTFRNRVQSNLVGTNANGTTSVANGAAGIHVANRAQNNLIGGPSPSVRNFISGNTFAGVLLSNTDGNTIQSNAIGTDVTGDNEIGNLLHGISVQGGQNNIIGTGPAVLSARAPATNSGNLIAFNRTDGVHVDNRARSVSIRGNLISQNGALGINLTSPNDLSNGVTLNDAGDSDSGPNALQNFPIITDVQLNRTTSGTSTLLSGTLNSTPNENFLIDFYRSREGNDSGYGEGSFYLGSIAVRTNGAGDVAFNFAANGDLRGQIFTATATSVSDGNTSEFGLAALQITRFEPSSGPVGTEVIIRGAGFRGVTNVFFNGAPSNFSIDSLTQITAVVPDNASSGPIRITTESGQTQSAESFTVSNRPANDDFERAQVLAATGDSVGGTNLNATAQEGEPDHADNTAESSVWYRWTAPASGIAIFDTQDSTFDTVLAVYTGRSLNALQLIAENDDGGAADDSRVRFLTVAGQTYSIAIDGFEGVQGALVLNYALTPVRPPNDLFARAQVLDGARGRVKGSNLGATKESGEPDHAEDTGGRSVWYRWTADNNGTATFRTQGSDFDTLLAVYTGESVDSLQLIAENDDGADGFNSLLSFEARRGQTYFIAVDGYDGDEGIVALGYVLGSSGGGTIRWAKPVSGNWNNPDNWQPADGLPRVPGPGDLALIDVDGTYTVALDIDTTVSGLNLGARNGRQVLAMQNNSLSLNGRSRIGPNAALDFGGTELNVQSDLFVGGLIRWSAGKLRGEGTLQIERTGTLSLEGSADKLLSISSVRSFGATNWRGSGDIIAGNGTIFLNYGTFSILNNATIRWDGIGEVPAIFNYNVLSKSQSNGVTTFVGVELDNQERGFLRSGILRLRGGGTSYGIFNIATGSRLEFTSAYFFAKESSNFTGGGDAVLIDGTFTIDTNGKPVTVSNFQLENGFLFGANEQSTLNAESFVWTGGGMRGKGVTNVSGDLNLSGVRDKTLSGRALNNNGQGNWNGSGDIVGSEGAILDNNGTLNTGDEQDFTFASGDPNTFNNDGTLNIGNAPEAVTLRRDLQPRAGIALPTGIFNMFGTYNQAAAGILNLDIGGTTPGASYDQLNVNGPANFNGTLNVNLGNDFAPEEGDVFRVVGYQARQGAFTINIANLPPGITLEAVYTSNALELRASRGDNPPPPDLSTIAGRITRLNGDAFPNARVELRDSSGKIFAVQTDANGRYRFEKVLNGTYSLVPQAPGFEWNPPTRSLQINGISNLSGADFIGLIAPSISGRLTTSNGEGLAGVTMRLSRAGGGQPVTAQSNANGFYGFEALSAGTYGVVPAMNAMLFNPPFLSATVTATVGVGNVNFQGTPFNLNALMQSISAVKLSTATATPSQILLNFTGPVDDATATAVTHYLVTRNDQMLEIESAQYRAATFTIVLKLAPNQLRTDDDLTVRWQNLRDAKQQVLAGSATARVR